MFSCQLSPTETQQAGPRQEERVREGLGYAPALAKLKQEADKIRKWKTATQFELKKKVVQRLSHREVMTSPPPVSLGAGGPAV